MPEDVTRWRRLWLRRVIVVPQDGAWDNDPFAASADYRLAEFRAGRWRIYCEGATPSQIPANQLKPCLLQNVSVKRW